MGQGSCHHHSLGAACCQCGRWMTQNQSQGPRAKVWISGAPCHYVQGHHAVSQRVLQLNEYVEHQPRWWRVQSEWSPVVVLLLGSIDLFWRLSRGCWSHWTQNASNKNDSCDGGLWLGLEYLGPTYGNRKETKDNDQSKLNDPCLLWLWRCFGKGIGFWYHKIRPIKALAMNLCMRLRQIDWRKLQLERIHKHCRRIRRRSEGHIDELYHFSSPTIWWSISFLFWYFKLK